MDENAREKAFQDTAKRKCCQMKPTGIIKIMPYLQEFLWCKPGKAAMNHLPIPKMWQAFLRKADVKKDLDFLL